MKADQIVGITMGDPAGIGPEIVTKLFLDGEGMPPAVVIGDETLIRREIASLSAALTLRILSDPTQAQFVPGVMNLVPVSSLPGDFPRGVVLAAAGRAAYDYIVKAVELIEASKLGGICTAPINKEALRAAGIAYPGHTEMLADLTHAPECAMMLIAPQLRTLLVTVHVSLAEAIRTIDIEKELRAIRIADRTLKQIGIGRPRIAVAGLNPHAGEGGLFGEEETEIITPAIRAAQREGINVTGPYPGDTVFLNARRRHFDIVVAQYHDQGLIPIKLLGIDQGVNITAGLPIVRTSVDHGTAFDIAGKGEADPSSLRAALKVASQLIQLKGRALS